MSWPLAMVTALLLVLPLTSAILLLALGRFLPRRLGQVLAALPLLAMAIGVIALVAWWPEGAGLEQTLNPPAPARAALAQVAPTLPWAQAPRTLAVPATEPTPTPTLAPDTTATPTAHPYSLATIAVRNGTGESGLAGRTSKRLQAEGFRILGLEDDPLEGQRPHTLILDRGDHPEVRRALAAFLHVESEYVVVNSTEPSETGADIVLILGDDYSALASATPLPTPTLPGGPTATPNPYVGVTIVVRNGTMGRAGLAGRVSERLRARGFTVLPEEDDDKAGMRPHTLLLDRGDHTLVRQALADYLKVAAAYIEVNSTSPSAYGANIIIILGDDFEE